MNTSEHVAALREQGYTVIEKLLIDNEINRLKSALEPWLNGQLMGRNNFEGEKSERVYALLAKHPDFALLVEHKKILAILDEMLEPDYLLSANLAINVHRKTPQPFHHDNNGGSFGVAGVTHGISVIWNLMNSRKTTAPLRSSRAAIDSYTKFQQLIMPLKSRCPRDQRWYFQDHWFTAAAQI